MVEKFVDERELNGLKMRDEGGCVITYHIIEHSEGINHKSYPRDKEKTRFCCQKMEEEFNQSIEYHLDYNHKKRKISVVLSIISNPHSDCSGDIDYNNTAIDYCPFCGSKIEITCTKHLKEKLIGYNEVVTQQPKYELEEI